MGNINTKSFESGEETIKNDLEISIGEVDLEDPRSPTPDINRTPIQTLESSKLRKITKNVDLSKECFEKCDKNALMNPSIRAIMSQIDPRSPTLDFQRTPLAVLLKDPELIAKYNQLNSSTNLDSSAIENKEEPSPIPRPVNLDTLLANLSVTPADDEKVLSDGDNLESSPENVECYPDSVSDRIPGLLETNLDYLETDLDTVRRKKIKKISPVSDKQDEKVVQIDEKQSNDEKIDLNIMKIKDLSDKDPRSPSVEINRTPIVFLENKEVKSQRAEIHTKIQEIFDNNMRLQQKRIDDKIQDSNTEFLLIYEDNLESKISTPIKKSTSVQRSETNRTPLACMMNTHQSNNSNSNKSQPISKKSKIPIKVRPDGCFIDNKARLQSFSKRNIPIDSIENTPPKVRQARWDQDNSVLL